MAVVNRVLYGFKGVNATQVGVSGLGTITVGGPIAYTELIDTGGGNGLKETLSSDQTTATRIAEVPWMRRREFVLTMKGFSYGLNGKLFRVLPQAYSAWYPSLYCTAADMTFAYGGSTTTLANPAAGQDAGDSVFTTARYQLTFSKLPYALLTDTQTRGSLEGELNRYVQRESQHSADSFTVPSGAFKWVTPRNDAIQEGGVPRVFPTRQLDYIWHDVPGSIMPSIRAHISNAIGRVNSVAFDNSRIGTGLVSYPAQTILFLGAKEELTNGDDGTPFSPESALDNRWRYRVKFNFLYRNNGAVSGVGINTIYAGWNHLLRGPSFTPQFQLATADGTANGTRIYGTYPMANLFVPNQIIP